MFFTRPQKQNGSVSWRQDKTESITGWLCLPHILELWGLSFLLFVCICRVAFSLPSSYTSQTWHLNPGRFKCPEETDITVHPNSRLLDKRCHCAKVRCPHLFKELNAEGSGNLMEAQERPWGWEVTGSQVDIHVYPQDLQPLCQTEPWGLG